MGTGKKKRSSQRGTDLGGFFDRKEKERKVVRRTLMTGEISTYPARERKSSVVKLDEC